jgi:hypothetical protein
LATTVLICAVALRSASTCSCAATGLDDIEMLRASAMTA